MKRPPGAPGPSHSGTGETTTLVARKRGCPTAGGWN